MDREALKKISVIVIDDEEEILDILVSNLERKVGALYRAGNGEEGLEKITAHKPDVIVTDLEMPRMNGLQMIERLQELDRGYRPIIVATAYDDEHKSEHVDAYIYKPLNMKMLLELIYDNARRYDRI